MAHQVATMAYAGEVPLHGLGVPVSNDLTPQQMMEKAGVDWNVREVESFIEFDGKRMATGQKSLVRETDGRILTNGAFHELANGFRSLGATKSAVPFSFRFREKSGKRTKISLIQKTPVIHYELPYFFTVFKSFQTGFHSIILRYKFCLFGPSREWTYICYQDSRDPEGE